MKILSASLLTISILAAATVSRASAPTLPERNKEVVRAFYDLAFNQHKPVDAAMKYLAVAYIQHNPGVADGRQGFLDAFPQNGVPDTSSVEFKRLIAENDLVVLHSHGHDASGDLGYAVVDIFRVTDGIITEHWDVGQKVPATSKNTNTMF